MKRAIFLIFLLCTAMLATNSTLPVRYAARRQKQSGNMSTRITMLFAGDIMAHDVNYTRKPYSNIYESIRDVAWDADLSFANLEFVFDSRKKPSGYPFFNAPVDYVMAAVRSGFNVFSLANNHSLDLGADSAIHSRLFADDLAEERRIYFNGINLSVDQYLEPTYFTIHGVRVGFLAVTAFVNGLSTDKLVNVVPFYTDGAQEILVERVREMSSSADLFILSYHGGVEYRREPVEWKKELFRSLIDAGVDILWSHHPHVNQAWEGIQKGDGLKLILYSTGNLISGQTWNASPYAETSDRDGTGESALYKVESVIGEDGVRVRRVVALPIFNHRLEKAGMVVKRFDRIGEVELLDDWQVYYEDRLLELNRHMYDRSAYDFVR